MINHGKAKSTIQPETIVIDDFSVWVHSNIVQIEEQIGEETFISFEYDMVQYDKNEYIKILSENNQNLEQQLLETQIALTEMYESMVI